MEMADIRLQAKDIIIQTYGFHILQWSRAVWEVLVDRKIDDLIDAIPAPERKTRFNIEDATALAWCEFIEAPYDTCGVFFNTEEEYD